MPEPHLFAETIFPTKGWSNGRMIFCLEIVLISAVVDWWTLGKSPKSWTESELVAANAEAREKEELEKVGCP